MVTVTLGASATSRVLHRVSAAFAIATVAAHIIYPLTNADGEARRLLTIIPVVLFFCSSLAHVTAMHGLRGAGALVGLGAGFGWVFEAVGVATGIPFGRYQYADTLGWKLGEVIAIVPLAWAMMAWPALVAARRTKWPVPVAVAILVTWDLFLDPQMVGAGHWVWKPTSWPKLHDIPISNSIGWTITATVIITSLHRVMPKGSAHLGADASRAPAQGLAAVPLTERVPLAMVAWTWFSETFGFIAFFGRPTVSLIAGPAMALALWPVVATLGRSSLRGGVGARQAGSSA
jgi:uncharacterized membrane protein